MSQVIPVNFCLLLASEVVVSEATKIALETLHPGMFEIVTRGVTEVKVRGSPRVLLSSLLISNLLAKFEAG